VIFGEFTEDNAELTDWWGVWREYWSQLCISARNCNFWDAV